MLVALQFALTSDIALPEPGWAGGGVRGALPGIAALAAPNVLLQRTIFSPLRTASGNSETVALSPGIAVAGTVTVRGRSFAIIQTPGGKIVRVPLGGRIGGMRLVALNPTGAEFIAQGKRISVAFGAAAISPALQDSALEEEQE